MKRQHTVSLAGLVLAALASLGSWGCATDDPARVRTLESDQKALGLRHTNLERAATSDLKVRDLRQASLERVQKILASSLDKQPAYLVVRPELFQKVLDGLVPLKMKTAGSQWHFTKPKVEMSPEGIRVALQLKVGSPRIQKVLKRPAAGTLLGVLQIVPHDKHAFLVRYSAVSFSLADRDFRVSSALHRQVEMSAFEGLVPAFQIPIRPAAEIGCCGKTVPIHPSFDANHVVTLPMGVLIPFSMKPGQAVVSEPPKPAAEPPKPEAGQTPPTKPAPSAPAPGSPP